VAAVNLFGLQETSAPDFWVRLNPDMVRRAFREKARLYHPDVQGQARPEIVRLRQERFLIIKDSYDLLKRFLGAGIFKTFG
jgi:flagellar biosynthesis protein FlhG